MVSFKELILYLMITILMPHLAWKFYCCSMMSTLLMKAYMLSQSIADVHI